MNAEFSHFSLNRKAATLSIGVALFLVAAKLYAWLSTDSVSLLSSLLDSTLDVMVSSLNLGAIIWAAKPADDDHRFGHDAIEDIVGLAQAVFIGASGLFLIYESGQRMLTPKTITDPRIGIGILLLSILCTLGIVLYQRYVQRKTGSLVIEADSLHYFSDFMVNLSIIASLLIASQPGWSMADPLIAVGIAVYIMRSAIHIGLRAFDSLMNRELPDETRKALVEALNNEAEILGFHELKTTRSGSRNFIQLHLELDEQLTLKQSHVILQRVEDRLREVAGPSEIIIHQDPMPSAHPERYLVEQPVGG